MYSAGLHQELKLFECLDQHTVHSHLHTHTHTHTHTQHLCRHKPQANTGVEVETTKRDTTEIINHHFIQEEGWARLLDP